MHSEAVAIRRPLGSEIDNVSFCSAASFLCGGLIAGGIQSYAPLLNFFVEALALFYLGIIAVRGQYVPPPRSQTAFALLLLAVPLAQLVPLPPQVWSHLPERALVARTDLTIGLEGLWRPLTLSTEGTIRAAVSLLPPLALFLTTGRFSPEQRVKLFMVILAVAAFSLVLSAVQFGSSPGSYRFYRGVHDSVPVGIFANRNHQATFMLMCIPLSAAIVRLKVRATKVASLAIAITLSLAFTAGVFATNSRAGFVLVPAALFGSFWVFLRGNPSAANLRRSLWIKIGIGIALSALLLFEFFGAAGVRTLSRFDDLTDLRFAVWPRVAHLISIYMPWGSGLGTFDPVFRGAEDLNTVTEKYINHAHNDYLEILLESGIAGGALMLMGCGILVLRFFKLSAHKNPLEFAAGLAMVLALAHSLVDYPLRTYTISMAFAVCAAVFLNPQGGGWPSFQTRIRAHGREGRSG